MSTARSVLPSQPTAARADSGFALLTALFVVALLGIALAILAAALQIRLRLVRQESEILALRALSDAALAETLASLAYDQDFPGSTPHAFGGGTIESQVTPVSPGRFVVVARALHNHRGRTVRADVARAPGHAWVTHWERVAEGRAPR